MTKLEHPLLNPRNFWPASTYLVLLGVLSAELVELNNAHHWISNGLLTLMLLVLVGIGGYRLFHRLRRASSRRREVVTIIENEGVRAAAALIAFVSQGPGRSSALQASEYHAKIGTLRHLWLVTSHAAEGDALWVKAQLEGQQVRVHELQFLEDKDSIPETKRLVEHLRARAMKEFHIPEDDLICDFTGLTKNASAGMILACAPKPARLQYMVPNRPLADGRADTTAGSLPREIFIRYSVIQEE